MDKIEILMYHDVYRESPLESGFPSKGACYYKVSEGAFEQQVRAIASYEDDNRPTLTFDDGGTSFYTIIAPILEKYNLKGVFFIATDYIGTDGFMTGEQVRELAERGHIIGSHSCSHNADMGSMSFDERRREWTDSVKLLSEIIGQPITCISVPNGYVNYEDSVFFKELGITTVYTSKIGEYKNREGILFVGRYGIKKSLTIENFNSVLCKGGFYKKEKLIQDSVNLVKSVLGQNNYGKIKSVIRKHQK